jgi:hypothetical protein
MTPFLQKDNTFGGGKCVIAHKTIVHFFDMKTSQKAM